MPISVIKFQNPVNLNVAGSRCEWVVPANMVTPDARACVYSEKYDGSYAAATFNVTCGFGVDAGSVLSYAFPTAASISAGPGRSALFSIDGTHIVATVGTLEGSAGSANLYLVLITE